MNDSPRQIAGDLHNVERAMRFFGDNLKESAIDVEHIQTRLGDFSEILSTLRQRVLSLPNQQKPEEKPENES